jgi:hypothetical protein
MQTRSPTLKSWQDMHQIIPNLWLGSIIVADDKKLFDDYNIKYRLSVLKEEMTVLPVCRSTAAQAFSVAEYASN